MFTAQLGADADRTPPPEQPELFPNQATAMLSRISNLFGCTSPSSSASRRIPPPRRRPSLDSRNDPRDDGGGGGDDDVSASSGFVRDLTLTTTADGRG